MNIIKMNKGEYLIISLILMLVCYIGVLPIITIFKHNKVLLNCWVIALYILMVNALISLGYCGYKLFKD
jgi:hypothetical protein